ncbi:ethanolamine ammonia-lyase subunit EutB [Novosphingobium profundi]|uniref:ethanolamine ammonia-lyase subunit EutB n=1 Tax=Novosphingobium profundi TaxID=1774954 RepID=UPI001FEBD909|nr:ethanolamine ammonia-lyase subunit EutB [Novosphingobium profundi]MBT0670717.1 ethanolamine ammonia-lyase subunit EutB [Novosphingobium profundi]
MAPPHVEVSVQYRTDISGTRHTFRSLGHVLACASPLRSGDVLAGLAAENAEQRVAARWVLADLPLTVFLEDLLIPAERDEVTRLILERHDARAFAPIRHLTVGGLREWLLDETTQSDALRSVARGITPEMAAAVSKVMRNQDLVAVSRKVEVTTSFRNTIGLSGRLSTRLQPNDPTDSPRGIAAAILDGLLLGSGDAVIGINPATDDVANIGVLLHMLDEIREALAIPTQSCVLTHVTNTLELIRKGAPVDLCFQSIAGTQAANEGFGISLSLLREAWDATLALNRGTLGRNVMYFETGQGSCLSSDAHHGIDQQTLECRAYEVARSFDPLLVNSVVGFIGPEYLYDGKQILRAALEDHFCGKLLGLPMGLDICYTNHAEADQDDMDVIATVLGVAGVSFIMGIPGADDVMLGYQSTSFHDALYLRDVLGLRPAPEFEDWLTSIGIFDPAGRLAATPRLPQLASSPALAALL